LVGGEGGGGRCAKSLAALHIVPYGKEGAQDIVSGYILWLLMVVVAPYHHEVAFEVRLARCVLQQDYNTSVG